MTDSYLYDGFGNTVQSTGTSIVPYHFVGCSGYYLDQELAEYYVRARQYSPTLARWLSQDPIGHTGRSANLYDYSRNAPLVIVDPTGLQPIQFPTPIELTPEYVEKMKARCKNIIDNQPPGKLFEPSDLPADQQDCCDKRKNKALKSLLKQPKPTSCNIKVECKKCPSYYSGWTNPPVVKSDGTTDVTVVLCWPTPKGDTFSRSSHMSIRTHCSFATTGTRTFRRASSRCSWKCRHIAMQTNVLTSLHVLIAHWVVLAARGTTLAVQVTSTYPC